MNEWSHDGMLAWINAWMDEWIAWNDMKWNGMKHAMAWHEMKYMHEWASGWMLLVMDGGMDGWMDGLMDGWM